MLGDTNFKPANQFFCSWQSSGAKSFANTGVYIGFVESAVWISAYWELHWLMTSTGMSLMVSLMVLAGVNGAWLTEYAYALLLLICGIHSQKLSISHERTNIMEDQCSLYAIVEEVFWMMCSRQTFISATFITTPIWLVNTLLACQNKWW